MKQPIGPFELNSEAPISMSRARASWTCDVELIFLVGCPRSGTTWLQAMLACHPAIYTGPETQFFSTFAAVEKEFLRPKDRRVGLSEYFSKEAFYSVMAELFWATLSRLPPPPSIPVYFLEKTPHHCVYADFILGTFPSARFIHLIRDGRAVVSSLLRASQSWGRDWAAKTAGGATKVWSKHVREGREIARRVQHPAQYIELRYEELRRQPHQHLARLFEWLGIPADMALINAAVDANGIDRIRHSQEPFGSIPTPGGRAITPIIDAAYPAGFIGPAPYDVDAVPITRLQRLRVEYLAGSLLRELGYTVSKERLSLSERLAIAGMALWERAVASHKLGKLLRGLQPSITR